MLDQCKNNPYLAFEMQAGWRRGTGSEPAVNLPVGTQQYDTSLIYQVNTEAPLVSGAVFSGSCPLLWLDGRVRNTKE